MKTTKETRDRIRAIMASWTGAPTRDVMGELFIYENLTCLLDDADELERVQDERAKKGT